MELNSHRISERIKELENLKEVLESKLNVLSQGNYFVDDIFSTVNNLIVLKQKTAKWHEIKSLYDLNISIVVFDKKVSLTEAEKLTKELAEVVDFYDHLVKNAAKENKNNVELNRFYQEFRKQSRLYNHYLNAVNIAKTQVGKFELDDELFND